MKTILMKSLKHIFDTNDTIIETTLPKLDIEYYHTSIEIYQLSSQHTIKLYIDKNLAIHLNQTLVEEEKPTEEMNIDICKEFTNLLIGHAKVLAEQSEKSSFSIDIPKFLNKTIYFENFGTFLACKINDKYYLIVEYKNIYE